MKKKNWNEQRQKDGRIINDQRNAMYSCTKQNAIHRIPFKYWIIYATEGSLVELCSTESVIKLEGILCPISVTERDYETVRFDPSIPRTNVQHFRASFTAPDLQCSGSSASDTDFICIWLFATQQSRCSAIHIWQLYEWKKTSIQLMYAFIPDQSCVAPINVIQYYSIGGWVRKHH